MKKTLIILAILSGISLLYINYTVDGRRDNLISKIKVFIFDSNTLVVNLESDPLTNDLKIIDNYGRTLYKDGEIVNRIKNEYGHTIFSFYINDTLIADAGHFKTNWWHTHYYKFTITEKNKINFHIDGPNKNMDKFVNYP